MWNPPSPPQVAPSPPALWLLDTDLRKQQECPQQDTRTKQEPLKVFKAQLVGEEEGRVRKSGSVQTGCFLLSSERITLLYCVLEM